MSLLKKELEKHLSKLDAEEKRKKREKKQFKKALKGFYTDIDYKNVKENKMPLQSNIRTWVLNNLRNSNLKIKNGNKLRYKLKGEEATVVKYLFLHESLFYFYKSFSNILTCDYLKKAGVNSWYDVTAYYAALYLAQATNTLFGNYACMITNKDDDFNEKLFEILNRDDTRNSKYKSYRMEIKTNINNGDITIVFSNYKLRTHSWIWNSYNRIGLEKIGVSSVYFSNNIDGFTENISDYRSKENYTVEGYLEIQNFSEDINNFKQQYEIGKLFGGDIYEGYSGEVLYGWFSLYKLYKKLDVNKLPIEKEKFYILINNIIRDENTQEQLKNDFIN